MNRPVQLIANIANKSQLTHCYLMLAHKQNQITDQEYYQESLMS